MNETNDTLMTALNIMKIVANSAACCFAYNQLNKADFWIKKDCFERIKKETDKEFWDKVFALDNDDKLALGFRFWDESHEGMLIPLWIIECLPDDYDIEVVDINGQKSSIKDIDKDVRIGCVAYMI